MRELTRSMMRLTWAIPLLGMNQVANLVAPADRSRPLDPATETLESLADVAYRQLGPRFRDVYEQGDRLGGRVVDAVFGLIPGTGGECGPCGGAGRSEPRPVPNPPAAAPVGAQPSRGAAETPEPVEGWGPVPPA